MKMTYELFAKELDKLEIELCKLENKLDRSGNIGEINFIEQQLLEVNNDMLEMYNVADRIGLDREKLDELKHEHALKEWDNKFNEIYNKKSAV